MGVVGYSLAFGPDIGGVFGSLRYLGLAGVGSGLARMQQRFRI